MEKENNNNNNNNNKLILKFSKIFTSSCKTQDISKVIDHNKNPIFTPLMNSHYPNPNPNPNPKLQQQPPLICKPKCPDSFDFMVRQNCIIATTPSSPRRKITGRYTLLSPVEEFSGRRCPPASPISPKIMMKNHKNKGKMKMEKTHLPNDHPFNFSSSNETDYFSSDDEREEEEDDYITKTEYTKTEHPLFSSLKSVSFSSKSVSLSSDSDPDQGRVRTRVRTLRRRRRRAAPAPEKVKESFAVVKSSRDPYSDFRTSMVEMIMEKQIFGSKELESLLKCFISLNSPHHHRVILEVFTEICDALFSNWS